MSKAVPEYYGSYNDVARLDVASLVNDIRKFPVFYVESRQITIAEAQRAGLEYDPVNSVDGAVHCIIRGFITGEVELVVEEKKNGKPVMEVHLASRSHGYVIQFY